ncbi:MAG: succinate dehydrogenase, cytochrome b556 subunit [Rickettsiales bacterium]|nr:succinate dehydrogenase, cytochrome b556 subunit [Rickettsiales bacterium]
MTTQSRPLSPHLQVYRPQITSMMSISHRASGVFLSLGAIMLVGWLWAAAYDIQYFNELSYHFSQWYGLLFLLGWTKAFFYHLANGIRHLFWDIGKGYALANVTRSGVFVILFALGMTALVWYNIYEKGLINVQF